MLLKPIITEKSLRDAGVSRFTFRVDIFDTKTTIKKLIEKTFGVKVLKIQTQIRTGKTRRRGKRGIVTSLPDWKRAVVTLAPGQKIPLFENLGQK